MRQVFCTCPEEAAERIATTLLEDRLVACVQMFPVKSRYWWRGKIESASEVMLLMKTQVALVARLIARVRQLHPYEVPEVVTVSIEEGNSAYLDWINGEVNMDLCRIKT